MHPRNRYRENKPDFRDLAEHRPSLRPYLIQKKTSEVAQYPTTLDFSDPDALRELACAVLSKDFGLEVVLPVDRLVPMVPQRLNYIHWLEDLLHDEREGREGEERKPVHGIDIGTGASCIYPLLGATLNDWRFLATEVDDTSVQYALNNISKNNLQEKINVVKVAPSDVLIGAVREDQEYDFVMCNPPFYEDAKEKYEGKQRTEHRPLPQTFSTGTEGETVTTGGELGFVRRILHDSLILRTQIRWYTSMLGKKTSAKSICQELKQNQVPVVVTTRFIQGKTHRWAVAWSFDKTLTYKVTDSLPLHSRPRKRDHALSVTVHTKEKSSNAAQRVLDHLHTSLTQLEIVCREEASDESGGKELVCEAHKNTWSHQRKRKRLQQRLQHLAKPGLSVTGLPAEGEHGGEGMPGYGSSSQEEKNNMDNRPGKTSGEEMVQDVSKDEGTASESGVPDLALGSNGANEEFGTPELPIDSESTREQQDIWQQIEALNSPCYARFSCNACLSARDKPSISPPGKKAKLKMEPTADDDEDSAVLLTFEWIQGDNKDILHQIVQYLKNTIFK